MDFCHCHVHSDFSLLDGAAKVDDLARKAAEQGMSSIALTDHGHLCGAVAFYEACQKHGVKPIIGMETYMAPGPRTDRRRDPLTGVSSFHLTLMARNATGYRNLVELASTASVDGFYYNPRIDHDVLRERSDGLLVMSGCLKGEVPYYLRKGYETKAYETAEFYKEVFGDNYFIELMRNGANRQEENNHQLVKLARDLNLPLICSNDVHYIQREDALAQEVRIAISTGKTLSDENRLKHRSTEYFLKGPQEMAEIFKDLPEAVHGTLEVSSRCNVDFNFGEMHLPSFDTPEGHTQDTWFRHLCETGLRERYGDPPPARAIERLEYEMGVIEKMGFVSYFLIVQDFIDYARRRAIPVGPGRGSAAGSIVAYVLQITNVDPLEHDLLFERFLNSERLSMPDIDIDFCRDGRAEVIEYTAEKYGGQECVSQIITFGTMAARAVVRDVGRALDVPLRDVDLLAKKVPNGPGATLQGAIDGDPELAKLRESPEYRQLFDVALRLEGVNRHHSTHAAGVVIGDGPLKQYVPLLKAGDDVVTQFTMDHLEQMGLLKMDFLGLKTLTVLDKAVKSVKRNVGIELDLDHLPADDAATWEMLQQGDALGIFQLESGGMRDLLRRLRPDRFEDLVAILALYRPGPLQTGMVDQFVRRKHGQEEVSYLHDGLKPLLEDTYGTFVYQEQIMLIAHQFAGFTMNEADGLRKAMGKKKLEVMLKYKAKFVDGCVANDCDRSIATAIWEVMEQFAKYAFNKSHTCAYAVVSYQTAYLKANHPAEFMAALMSCDMGNTEKIVMYADECRRMGIEVLPPSIARSESDFSVERDADANPSIRFGLAAIKGVGHSAVDAILETRAEEPLDSLADLCERVDHANLNRATVETLVKAGACDEFGGHRAQLQAAVEGAMRAGQMAQADRRAGQMALFGAPSGGPATTRPEFTLPDAQEWSDAELLAAEKETLGLYMSSHPLARHEPTLRAFTTHDVARLAEAGDRGRVLVGGMLTQVKTMYPKTGRNTHRKMARFRLEDFSGNVGCVMFSDGFEQCGELLVDEAIGFVDATVDTTRESPDLRVDAFIPVERVFRDLAGAVVIKPRRGEAERAVEVIRSVVERHPGRNTVMLLAHPVDGVRALYRFKKFGIDPSVEAHEALCAELGVDQVRWKRKRRQG